MSPIAACLLLVLVPLVLFTSRRSALLAMVIGILYLTQGNMVNLAGFNMYSIRFLELAGFIRVIARKEFSFSRLSTIDRTFLCFYVYSTAVFLLRSTDGQVNQIGMAIDASCCYFTFRGLITDLEGLRWLLRVLVLLLVPYVAMVLVEKFTFHNLFFPGAIVWIRDGKLRCVGSFRHPSLLGTLGASFLPLYIALVLTKKDRYIAAFGIGLCLMIVWAANSGGPISCALVAVIGWAMWRIRDRMHLFRRSLVGIIVVCAFTMKAPIWYLLAKISDMTGGDGWHRSYLLDIAYQNLGKWWLVGIPINQTASWFPYVNVGGTEAADITNQFLAFGLNAGLPAMILFVTLLKRTFRNLRMARTALAGDMHVTRDVEFLYWGLNVLLAVHIFNWFGISYFDQTYAIWFMHLAAITSLAIVATRPESKISTAAVKHSETACETSAYQRPTWGPIKAGLPNHMILKERT